MTGCRHGAKNSLTENYLHLAERAGAVVHPMTTVTEVAEDGRGGFTVTTVPTNRRRRGRRTVLRCERVVLAAGTYLQVPHGGRAPKLLTFAAQCLRHPVQALRTLSNYRWSERTIIGLVMQSLDNSLTTYRKPKGLGKGLPNVGELMGMPLTAHFLGGCPIGATAEEGVIDPYHRLHGHPGISAPRCGCRCCRSRPYRRGGPSRTPSRTWKRRGPDPIRARGGAARPLHPSITLVARTFGPSRRQAVTRWRRCPPRHRCDAARGTRHRRPAPRPHRPRGRTSAGRRRNRSRRAVP